MMLAKLAVMSDCAAAMLEHFEGRGIDIFANYDYCPNQKVYHKIFYALEEHEKRVGSQN